jgi:hypothetical protein
MITRLWFVLSVGWVAFWLWGFDGTPVREWRFDGCPIDSLGFWFCLLLPFIAGLLVRIAYRYVRFGPRLRDPGL